MSDSKKSIFNTKDETELFHSRDFWCEPDNLIETLNLSMVPHSELYYSKSCPIFSYELVKLDSLNLFSSILLRDGIVFLLDFFLRYPQPHNIRTKVLINADFSTVVPRAWSDNVLFYNFESVVKTKTTSAIYIVNIDHEQPDLLEMTKEDLEKLRSLGFSDIELIPTAIRGSSKDAIANGPYEVASFIDKITNANIKFSSMSKLQGRNLKDTSFMISDALSVWCGDTYLRHLLLSSGSTEIIKEKPAKIVESLELSLFHKMNILNHSIDLSKSDEIWKFISDSELVSNSTGSMNRIDGGLDDYINSELTSLAREILKLTLGQNNFFSDEK